MTVKHASMAAVSVVALSALAPNSQAASVSLTELKPELAVSSGIEKAAYRSCWWRNGYRVCRWVGYHPYYDFDDYGYYGYGPYYGFGPGIGFRFGGGHFHGHHR
jgi:hypothetical protein